MGNGDCTVYSAPRSSGGKRPVEIPGRQLLAPARNQNSSDQAKNRQHAAQPDQLENRRAIGGRRGVVLIAKKEHVVGGRADFSLRGVYEAEAHVPARVFNPIEVARDAAVRGEQEDAARMGEEICFGAEAIAKVGGLGDAIDGFSSTR